MIIVLHRWGVSTPPTAVVFAEDTTLWDRVLKQFATMVVADSPDTHGAPVPIEQIRSVADDWVDSALFLRGVRDLSVERHQALWRMIEDFNLGIDLVLIDPSLQTSRAVRWSLLDSLDPRSDLRNIWNSLTEDLPAARLES